MHPISNIPSSPWMVDDLPQTTSESSGPTPVEQARLDRGPTPNVKGKERGTMALDRPALVLPTVPSMVSGGHVAPDATDDAVDDWPWFSNAGNRPDPNAPENDRVSEAGRAWQLGSVGQDSLCSRLPTTTADWTRRLEFSTFPDAEDWRWLPAYRQRCPNLVEIVLPRGSEVVVPALVAHADREADGRWLLRTPGRHDGVRAFERLCNTLGRPLHDVVERPGVLGSHGRPRVFEQLARDVVTLRGEAPVGPAMIRRVRALLTAIVDDPQVAVRCALVTQQSGTAGDRLAGMEAVAAELRRAPFVMPRSSLPLDAQDEAARMIGGLSRATDCGPCSMYASETLFLPKRPRWLDRAEADTMSRCLRAVPDAALIPALRAQRDAAVQVLRPDPAFGDMAFLSRDDEDLVSEALHLARLFGARAVLRIPGGLIVEAMPDSAKRALAGLRQWVGKAPAHGHEALRRERWYVHLAGQAHRGPDPACPTAGLLRGIAGEEDLDAPPVAAVAAIARSRGEALGLALDYRGETVFDPGAVNRLLAERFCFGVRFGSAHLEADRAPEALRWTDAQWLDIGLMDDDRHGGAAWRRRVGTELVRDFPGLTALSFGGDEYPDGRDPISNEALDGLRSRHQSLETVSRLLPGLVWNGRQRHQLARHAGFTSWLATFLPLYQVSTQRATGAVPPLVAPVLSRVLDDPAFASRCEELIRGQDGDCADAGLRILHQMALLKDVGEASDGATAVRVALQFACEWRADQWVIEAHGGFDENLEEAMLLRQAVRTRLAQRLGRQHGQQQQQQPGPAPVEAFETPIYARFGVAGDRWGDEDTTRRREQRADALIDAEVESGCDTSHDCLRPDGLIGDFLSKVLDRETGHHALEARLQSDAQTRYGAAIDAAGDDADAIQAANEAASQAQADVGATLAARRREQVLPHLAALTARLSGHRADDAPSAAP